MRIMDCTLRDGANVVGAGFSAELTRMILEGLTENDLSRIEMGNAKGIGAYEVAHSVAPLRDEEYLELIQPFVKKAEIGMFLNAKRFRERYVSLAGQAGLKFLRVGADVGDFKLAEEAVACVKECGMKVFYAMMKTYLKTPAELAEEAAALQAMGVDEITLMDSAGSMWPQEVERSIAAVKKAVRIPIGFHGHNNMYMALANCAAATRAGADIVDGCLLGMARSAGNAATEANVAYMYREEIPTGVNFFGLLHFLDQRLIPAMEHYGYRPPVKPLELILGYSGCHSSFVPVFRTVSKELGVDLYQLIVQVSRLDRKAPTEKLIRQTAAGLLEFHTFNTVTHAQAGQII